MKKANLVNLFIIIFIFSVGYILSYYLTQNNIVIYLKTSFSENLKMILSFVFFVIFSLTSIIYASKQVFNLFIKHMRTIKLTKSRYWLILSSLIVSYAYITFSREYYYYFGSIIILYLFYFIFLYLYDNHYVKVSQETQVEVNQEVVEKFLNLLGGKDNILSVSYEYSRLKVELKNIKLIKLDELKNLGAKGAFIAGNKLQAMIGNNAEELENAIKGYLSLV